MYTDTQEKTAIDIGEVANSIHRNNTKYINRISVIVSTLIRKVIKDPQLKIEYTSNSAGAEITFNSAYTDCHFTLPIVISTEEYISGAEKKSNNKIYIDMEFVIYSCKQSNKYELVIGNDADDNKYTLCAEYNNKHSLGELDEVIHRIKNVLEERIKKSECRFTYSINASDYNIKSSSENEYVLSINNVWYE